YPSTPERRAEDFPFQPIAAPDFYARSKRMAEDVVREGATEGDLEAVALRPNVIYGERDRLFTPRVIGAVRLPFVPQIGPGTNRLFVRLCGQRGGCGRRRTRRTARWVARLQRDERRAARTVAARVLWRVCGRARSALSTDTDSDDVRGPRDRPVHCPAAGTRGGVLRLRRESLRRRSHSRRAPLAAADSGPGGHRAHRPLVSRKRKARALVPGIVSVLPCSCLGPTLLLGSGLGGRGFLRRIGHHLVRCISHHLVRRVSHHHVGRVRRRGSLLLLLGLLTRAHRHEGEDHRETLHAGSSREKSSGAGFGRGKPSGAAPGVKAAARGRVY
ncbi:MAG: hypothetical protein DMD60_08740, partial [Gemmatimonadetes bacterium]